MLQRIERPLNSAERKLLRQSLERATRSLNFPRTLAWFSLWAGICALCFFLFYKNLSQAENPKNHSSFLIPACFMGGVFAFYAAYLVISSFFHLWRRQRHVVRADIPKLRAALDHGGASVCRIESKGVIVIEEFEDEGSVYIYGLGDGTSLYLHGPDYYPEEEEAPWPAGQFEIIRTAAGERLLGVFAAKEMLEPIRTVPMAEMPERFWSEEHPQTESIIPGDPEAVLQKLRAEAD